MHVLLFGFTSSIGLLALPHLRSSGHTLTAYVRSPDKLEGFDGLEIVQGELDEGDKIRGLFEGATPVDAILSCLGPSSRLWPPHPSDQPISRFYALLYQTLASLHTDALKETPFNVPRLIALGTLSQHNDAKDRFSLTARAAEMAIRIGAPTAYSDVKRWDHEIISAATRLSASWTIFRVGVLYTRSDPSQAVVAKSGYIGDGLVGVTLYRDDAALWIVRELDEGKWEGELMVVSS